MSDEYEIQTDSEVETEAYFSPFWPMLILVIGLLIWSGYQVFASFSQRSVYHQQFQSALPALEQAQNINKRYLGLMQDLVSTAGKDQYAAQIVRDAIQAGLIHVNNQQQPTASTDTNAASATPPAKQ